MAKSSDESSVHDHYDGSKVHDHYDHSEYFIERMEVLNHYAWLARLYDFSQARHILDVGAGPAFFWQGYAPSLLETQTLYLVDQSKSMLDIARKNTASLKCQRVFMQESIENLSSDNQFFDAILVHMMLYHTKDIHLALKELKRVLAPGGFIGITTLDASREDEAWQLIHTIDNTIPPHCEVLAPFCPENAESILKQHFQHIKISTYEIKRTVSSDAKFWASYFLTYPNLYTRKSDTLFCNKVKNAFEEKISKEGSFCFSPAAYHYLCR